MSEEQGKNKPILLVAVFFALIIPILLYLLRQYDDSRLTNWLEIAPRVNVTLVYAAIITGVVLAYLLSGTKFIYRGSVLFLFFLSFLISTIFWPIPEVIIDASRYFTQAKHLELYGTKYFINQWGGEIFAWTDLPLVPFLYGLIFRFWGESRLYVQVLNSLFFSSSIVITYYIGRLLWGREHGIWAGAFMLSIQYIYTQVPLMLVDTAAMFFLTASVFTFWSALRGNRAALLLSAVSIVGAMLTKYSLWPALSVLGVIYVLELKVEPVKKTQRALIILFLSSAMIMPFFIYKWHVLSEQLRILGSYQISGLKRWGESFAGIVLFQMHPFVMLSAVSAVFVAIAKREFRFLAVAWLLILVLGSGIRRIRYILPAMPMLALMASYGLIFFRNKRIRAFIALSAVFTSITVALFAYRPYLSSLSSANLKNAGMYLDSLNTLDVEVFVITNQKDINPAVAVPLLDIFTNKKIIFKYIVPDMPEDYLQSAFRFTWHYKNPDYYSTNTDSRTIAIITDDIEANLPSLLKEKLLGYKEVSSFDIADEYRFQTKVRIFVADSV